MFLYHRLQASISLLLSRKRHVELDNVADVRRTLEGIWRNEMQCDSGWKGVGARKKCQQKKQYDLRRKDSCEMQTKEQLLKEILSKGREQGKEESWEG